ncbi:phage replication initiation protein [Enterococcus pernyi]|uniref:replication initiation factor domain-containing protein n=1 Tax=unclassified Enterococcus TaxID=2608891 RepID=UPI003E17EF44
MTDKKMKTPVTNRGVINTSKPTLISTVDWFSCTFKNAKNWKEVCGVFLLDSTLFTVQDKGRNGYKKSAVFQSISIFFDGTPEMGIFVDLSGQACREYELTFEQTGFSWQSFFQYLLGFEINITRLDLAIDDFKGHFTLKQIENCIKKGCVVSKFRTGRNFEEHLLATGETLGQTIYFGKSDVMIRFYDKLEEREAKNYALKHDLDFWQRTELQIRKERAMEACKIISQGGALGSYICGILRNYLTFKIKGTDSNRSRWSDCKWWLKFLNSAEPIKLTSVHPYPSIIRKKEWIDSQVVGSLATVYTALDDDELFFDYIKILGKQRMSKEQIMIANEFSKNDISKNFLRAEMRKLILGISDKTKDYDTLTEFWYDHERRNGLYNSGQE